MKLLSLLSKPTAVTWDATIAEALDALYGADGGRYSSNANKKVKRRTPAYASLDARYAALIDPSNPDSGAYGGMSFVLCPVENKPTMLAFIVGTQGLAPDENTLGRPGHGRKVRALTQWINRKFGGGKQIAWAKHDPVRTDVGIPDAVQKNFPDYEVFFSRYGREIYGFCIPPVADTAATDKILKAFLDLYFSERGIAPLTAFKKEAEELQAEYQSYLLPDINAANVADLLADRRYVVLEGPPGTGKTELALDLLQTRYGNRGFSVQFHPNTTYEDFVGGLAPEQDKAEVGLSFRPRAGALMKAVLQAQQNPTEDFLLHIDEINRADLAKVLGEAIFLLEPKAKRERRVELNYRFADGIGSSLAIPPNLHILGTMNSADRSIAILDVAVRRRFAFVRLWPQLSVVEKEGGEVMRQAFRQLFDIFISEASDDAFHLLPGHAYFLEKDDAKAKRSLQVNLRPLLEEYLAQGYIANFADSVHAYLQWVDSL